MARYFFDLKDGIPVRDRQGHDCSSDDEAIENATFIAQRSGTERPEYVGKGHYISVVNEAGREIHRAPISSAGPVVI